MSVGRSATAVSSWTHCLQGCCAPRRQLIRAGSELGRGIPARVWEGFSSILAGASFSAQASVSVVFFSLCLPMMQGPLTGWLTADHGGCEGAAQDGRDGSAAGDGHGGALQEHDDRLDRSIDGDVLVVVEWRGALEVGLRILGFAWLLEGP